MQKSLLLTASIAFVPAGFVWGLMYWAIGDPLSGLIPACYALVTASSIGFFIARRHYGFFRFSQLLLLPILPLALQPSLGGFVNSSAVSLWSLMSVLGSLLFA